jgi:hypothetical protein
MCIFSLFREAAAESLKNYSQAAFAVVLVLSDFAMNDFSLKPYLVTNQLFPQRRMGVTGAKPARNGHQFANDLSRPSASCSQARI